MIGSSSLIPQAELNQIEFPSPSETVFKYTGAYGVSEPAAMRYAQVKSLLLEKKKSGNATISVARYLF